MRRRGFRVVLGATAAGLIVVGALLMVCLLRPLSVVDAYTRYKLWRAGVQSRFVVVDGTRLHYLEAPADATGGGTPLLLIHGLGARAQDWAPLLPGLAKAGFHVYAPDLPGYGLSDKPDIRYSIADEEAAVVGFLGAVHLERADVIGWSMGGWIAMRLSADHPMLVQRLVLYDAAGVYFPRDYDASLFTPTDVAGVGRLFARLTPKPKKLPGFIARDILRRSARNSWVLHRNVDSMTAGRDLMEFRLGEIHAPTLVLWGAEDTLIPSSAGEHIAAGIPRARFGTIAGCGHLMPAECSGAALAETVPFLRGEVSAADSK